MTSLPFLLSGLILGVSVALIPGPTLTLVISETLKHNAKAGIKVALTPFIADIVIAPLCIFTLVKLANFNNILGVISIVGALFLIYLAYGMISIQEVPSSNNKDKLSSLQKGITTELLNAHSYLFWLTVGSPIILKASHINLLSIIFFILGLYAAIFLAKSSVAILVHKSKSFLKSNIYLYTIKILGIVLLIFAFIFFKDGLQFFNLL